MKYIGIFIVMKNKSLSIRLNESQFKTLCDYVIENELTMSTVIRDLIENLDSTCRNDLEYIKLQKINNKWSLNTNIKNNGK